MTNNNELRLGNLLQDLVSGEWMRVIEITEEKIGCEILDESKFPLPNGWEMGPIKLTPEILEKVFGFGPILNWHYGLKNTIIKQMKDGTFLNDGAKQIIVYVHDLQNTYFLENGKQELPVNLEYATQRDKKADI